MILHTTEGNPLPGYRLALRFNNSEAGIVDLSGELEGEVFEPLRDPALFATAHQHPVMRTVAWANGADPLIDRLTRPHLDRARYPSLHQDDDWEDSLKAAVAAELGRKLIVSHVELPSVFRLPKGGFHATRFS